MWPHCSGVQLRCSRTQCNRVLMCAGDKAHKQQVVVRIVFLHVVCAIQFGGIWAFMQRQRAATPAVELLVSSGVCHIATGSDRLPLWRFSGVQTHVFYCRFDPLGNGSTAYGWHYDAHSALWQQQIVLHQLAAYRQPSEHLIVQMVSRIPRNYGCLRTEA
ncbi:hypothetical protein AVEN_103141-1 [Araneus ventricosus]|uniref:Uncharacterized protein n=1 Tax=Araneus ventricosus TaxID=182803 RepID=A0A4Y2SWA9_ARAVE|nr:hypothetical protein AVEN_103141-1 [Araneus ventricosus]